MKKKNLKLRNLELFCAVLQSGFPTNFTRPDYDNKMDISESCVTWIRETEREMQIACSYVSYIFQELISLNFEKN